VAIDLVVENMLTSFSAGPYFKYKFCKIITFISGAEAM